MSRPAHAHRIVHTHEHPHPHQERTMTTVYLIVGPGGETIAGALGKEDAASLARGLESELAIDRYSLTVTTVDLHGAQALMASSLLGGDL